MKKKRGLKINIKLSNRWLYFFITLGILIIAGVGVYAYGTSSPTTFGHSAGELDFSGVGSGVIPSNAITFNSPIVTPNMEHPYIVLDSGGGGNNDGQSAQISLGESGRGSAALHLAYTGDGYSYIGMGDLGSDNIPDYYAIRMYYGNRNVYFPGSISAGGSVSVSGTLTAGSGRRAIYVASSFCANSGTLSTSSTCSTAACGSWIEQYYTCSGTCSSYNPVTCSNTFAGYLV